MSVEISHLFTSQLPEALGLEGEDWGWLPFGFLFAQNLGNRKHSVKHWRRKGRRSSSCKSKTGSLFKHDDVSVQGHVTAPLREASSQTRCLLLLRQAVPSSWKALTHPQVTHSSFCQNPVCPIDAASSQKSLLITPPTAPKLWLLPLWSLFSSWATLTCVFLSP